MLRDYQIELAKKTYEKLKKLKIVYLAIEMRVGKTLIALEAARLIGAKNVLFVTQKKAIPSIIRDYQDNNYQFNLNVINYEQLNKIQPDYDCIIADESHKFGAYPKPSLRTRLLRNIVNDNYLLLLSGTPSPESYSQLYHQFWLSSNSPFPEKNFYKWAYKYINIRQKLILGVLRNDYSKAKEELIMAKIQDYLITYTREQAGFKQYEIIERVIEVNLKPRTYYIANYLTTHLMYELNGYPIVCDSAVKLQSKLHQIYSGTVKTDHGTLIIDKTKAYYIRDNYSQFKIAIYYKFIAEGEALREVLGETTNDPGEFKITNKPFVCQISSGGLGIDLSIADYLIFYNIDFSAALYYQARARLHSLNRTKIPEVHWIFSEGGIEEKILKVVKQKKNYTTYYFKKDYKVGKTNTK